MECVLAWVRVCMWVRVGACGCVWVRVGACGCVWVLVAACGCSWVFGCVCVFRRAVEYLTRCLLVVGHRSLAVLAWLRSWYVPRSHLAAARVHVCSLLFAFVCVATG